MQQRRKYLMVVTAIIVVVLAMAYTLHQHWQQHACAAQAIRVVHEVGSYKKIHVIVALCDNAHQGIVPVPAAIGNGQDTAHNLYWGARYGVKTFFLRSHEWKLVEDIANPRMPILERLIFVHVTRHVYLVADAYDGAYMKQAVTDVIVASAGEAPEVITIRKHPYLFGGGADLIAFVGHDGLLDFSLDFRLTPVTIKRKDAILLCCVSSICFKPWMKMTGANPLLWTTEVMCPEAYTLHAALKGWVYGASSRIIHEQAARAYSRYQHCSVKAAKKLLKTGY